MTTSPVNLLKINAAQLRNADRKVFELFTDALELYAIEAMEALTRAPPDQILAQQGRAQQCQALLRLFRDCGKTPQATMQQAPDQQGWAP